MVQASVSSKIGNLFHLPRNYAVGYQGRWSRVHEPISVSTIHTKLNEGIPLCVSVKDVTDRMGQYGKTMSFCVFDVDDRDNLDRAKATCFLISSYLTFEMKVPILVTFSGGKGFHIWVFFSKSLDEVMVSKFQYHVMTTLGFMESSTEEYTFESTHVETLIASGQGKVIKIPFSRHPAHTERYEFPIVLTDIIGFSPDAPINWDVATELFLKTKKVDSAFIESVAKTVVGHDYEGAGNAPRRIHTREAPFVIPDTAPHQENIMELIDSTPCLRACYLYVTNRKNKGGYEKRVNLVVALSNAGFTKEEVAVFFRNNINDEEDNTNSGMLEYQIRYWYGQKHLGCCRNFRKKHFRNFCCPGYCGKSAPDNPTRHNSLTYGLVTPVFMASIGATDFSNLETVTLLLPEQTPTPRYRRPRPVPVDVEPPPPEPVVEPPRPPPLPIPVVRQKDIMEMCGEILASSNHMKVLKTTRAGVTTSLTLKSVQEGKRVLQLEPTNVLCENKMGEIMKVRDTFYADTIMPFKGIALTDNRKACLDLLEYSQSIRERFGVQKSEYDKFPFAVKRSCEKCFYRNYPMKFDVGVPLCQSDSTKKECALITILNRIGEARVVTMTYSKFMSLLMAVNIGSKYAERIISELLMFDEVVFDEFSHFTDTPALDVLISETWVDGKSAYDMLSDIRKKCRIIARWKDTNVTSRLERVADSFVSNVAEVIGRLDKNSEMLNRVISEEDTADIQVNMMMLLNPLFDYMEQRNESVIDIYNMLQIIESIPVMLTDAPGLDYQHEIYAKKPMLFDEVRNFTSRFQGQIIVTDATMPKISPDAVFGVLFDEYNIGDPKNTAKTTMFFADNWEFIAAFKDSTLQDQAYRHVVDELKSVFKYYKPEHVMIVAPSIKTHDAIRERMKADYPFINITYQRSDVTIGRDSPFRVMVMIGAPFAPKNAFEWCKGFDPNVNDQELLEWNARKWMFQSASRVKDPEGLTNSVVIGIGIPYDTAHSLLDSRYLVNPPIVESAEKDFERQILKSLYWKQYGEPLDINDLNILYKYAKKEPVTERLPGYKHQQLSGLIQGIPR